MQFVFIFFILCFVIYTNNKSCAQFLHGYELISNSSHSIFKVGLDGHSLCQEKILLKILLLIYDIQGGVYKWYENIFFK